MVSAIFNPPYLSPTIVRKPVFYASHSTSPIPHSRTLINRSLTGLPQLGLAQISSWNGLRRNGFSLSPLSLRLEKKRKCKRKGVFASLFGVGAPEALVIGVVALLVFGPKGLADVAKNLGKTLRAFQPTIRELQDVSREFKSTLEKEIGLDELNSPVQSNYTATRSQPSGPPPSAAAAPESSQAAATAAATVDDSTTTTTEPPPVDNMDVSEAAAPGVTVEDSQPTVDSPNGSHSYSSEDLLKITEEQLKTSASVQRKDPLTSPESPSPSQDS